MNILEFIPYGKENAIKRGDLSKKTGFCDRINRRKIQDERLDGFFVMNFQDGIGYFQSSETEDLLHQFRINQSRMMSIAKQQTPIYRELKKRGVEVKWSK